MEMHLVAQRSTRIEVDDHVFEFDRGESIHTESSHKYSIEDFQTLAKDSGLNPMRFWLDGQAQFSMHCLEPV